MRMASDGERIVVTGIGMITSVGMDRETSWREVKRGTSGVRPITGLPGIPDGEMFAAMVDLGPDHPGVLKILPMCLRAAGEALEDARIAWPRFDATRFGCSINAHMGDTRWLHQKYTATAEDTSDHPAWLDYWLPNSTCAHVARRFGLLGPRTAHSTACASSLISILAGFRMLQDDQCDVVLAGGGDAIDPLFAAGFRQMRVLADAQPPQAACRPFDKGRSGFVMGEGAAMLILEKASHAIQRGATIYAEVVSGHILAEAHHVTGLDTGSAALARLIEETLRKGNLAPSDIGYINAHGTGTEQNDLAEMRAIRQVFTTHCRELCVSGSKSMLGHMINAAGAVELAITLLAIRDGMAPPTINLHDPDPECCFDCVPHVAKPHRFQHALKLSVAFGGHLAAIALRRWNEADSGFAYPEVARAA